MISSMAVRLLYSITLQTLSSLALLSRRRSVLITEVVTLSGMRS
jgi:hypothetical protein